MPMHTQSYGSCSTSGQFDFGLDLGDGRWYPAAAANALRDIATHLPKTRRLQLSLGQLPLSVPLKDSLGCAELPQLADLHLQSNAPLDIGLPATPGLLRLSLSGVQPQEWARILSDRLTHLDLTSLVIPLSELRSCLLYSHGLAHLSLSHMALIIDQPHATPVHTPNLVSLRLRLSDSRSTLVLLNMLYISYIPHIHVVLPHTPRDAGHAVEHLIRVPVDLRRLQLGGTTLELGGGDGQYLRRLENVAPEAIQHALRRSGLCDVVKDVTLDGRGLQLVSSVSNSLPRAQRLQVNVDSESDGNALRGYLAGPHRVSFPGLQELEIGAKRVARITSQKVLSAFMASLDARQLKRVDGASCR